MADEPVSAWREPLARRAARWARRHRTVVAGAAAVLLVAAVVGLSIGAVLINRERAKAEANFRQARAAVDQYFTTVSESKLLDVPGLQPLRKELLDAAQQYYRHFLREHGNDPAVRVEAASASFRVGLDQRGDGPAGRGHRSLTEATALYEELARSNPGDVEYRRLCGHRPRRPGTARCPASIAGTRRSPPTARPLRSARRWHEVQPRRSAFAERRGALHRNIGNEYRPLGRPEDALAEWDRASRSAGRCSAGRSPRATARST